jgi:hypothetical protein
MNWFRRLLARFKRKPDPTNGTKGAYYGEHSQQPPYERIRATSSAITNPGEKP